jgi:AraC-like DNA-binding protein
VRSGVPIQITPSEIEPDWRVAEARRIANQRFRDHGLTLKAIALGLGTQPGYLGKLFLKQVRVHFRRYVFELRMRAAAKALREGESIKSAAASAGYTDFAHFSSDFNRRFGKAPGKWRSAAPRGGVREALPIGIEGSGLHPYTH